MCAGSTQVGNARFDARDAMGVALRLALGEVRPDDSGANWSLVFDTAARELLAPLAWARSGPFIRRHADDEVAALWRRAAMAAHVRGERQLRLLHDVVAALDTAGVHAVVLKGLPLGEQLYGNPFVRCSADIDLYVAARERQQAAAVLTARGWRRTDGGPPWHESWSIVCETTEYHLELHSRLVSDHLAHVGAPGPTSAMVVVGGVSVRAHVGDFVAPYLAVHLATHQLPPLLWLVDFATLWRSLTAADRARAVIAAGGARLGRYLTWARDRSALVAAAAAGDPRALPALGIDSDRRRDMHSIWRHLALASGVHDRVRLVAAFLGPHRARGTLGAVVRYTVARLRTRFGALIGASRNYGASYGPTDALRTNATPNATRPLRLEREELVTFTREVVGAGAALWVRAPGGSMIPSIPRGALVRIGPAPTAGISVGDIVLALTSDGEPILHRAVTVRDQGVVTRGDAAIHADPFVPLSRVIGVATHVRVGADERVLSRRPRHSIAVSALKMRRRIARVLRRAD
jgi:hypothetical protein